MIQNSKAKLNSFSEMSLWQDSFMPADYLSLVTDNTKPNKGTRTPVVEVIGFRPNSCHKYEQTPYQKPIRVENIKKQNSSI